LSITELGTFVNENDFKMFECESVEFDDGIEHINDVGSRAASYFNNCPGVVVFVVEQCFV